jgi:hypothetical protein
VTNITTTTIFTTMKIAQAIINPCRTLATMTRTVVAREVNKANILRIPVIALPTKKRDRI